MKNEANLVNLLLRFGDLSGEDSQGDGNMFSSLFIFDFLVGFMKASMGPALFDVLLLVGGAFFVDVVAVLL